MPSQQVHKVVGIPGQTDRGGGGGGDAGQTDSGGGGGDAGQTDSGERGGGGVQDRLTYWQ